MLHNGIRKLLDHQQFQFALFKNVFYMICKKKKKKKKGEIGGKNIKNPIITWQVFNTYLDLFAIRTEWTDGSNLKNQLYSFTIYCLQSIILTCTNKFNELK